jgi:hypothetical protein
MNEEIPCPPVEHNIANGTLRTILRSDGQYVARPKIGQHAETERPQAQRTRRFKRLRRQVTLDSLLIQNLCRSLCRATKSNARVRSLHALLTAGDVIAGLRNMVLRNA